MRKLLLLNLLLSLSCWSQIPPRVMDDLLQSVPVVVAVVGCSGSSLLTNTTYNSSNKRLGDVQSTLYVASWFIPSSNMTVVTIAPYIRGLTTSPAYNFRAGIYSATAGTNPSTLVGSWSSYMPANYISLSSWAYTNMPGNVCATLSSNTPYFVVLNADAVDSNGLLWGFANSIVSNSGLQNSTNTTIWAVGGATSQTGFKLLGGP